MLDDPSKFVDEDFMMSTFDKIVEKLPPFKECLQHMCDNEKMSVVGDTGMKAVSMATLHAKLFNPIEESNQQTTELAKDLGKMAAEATTQELNGKKSICEMVVKC